MPASDVTGDGAADAVAGTQEQGAPEKAQTAPVTPVQKVDLTSIPEFREYQSKSDREREADRRANAALQKQVSTLTEQLSEFQRQMTKREQAELASLDPPEQIAALQRMLAEREAEDAKRAQREAEEAKSREKSDKIGAKMSALLNKYGITWQDPKIVAALQTIGSPEDVAEAIRDAVDEIRDDRYKAEAVKLAEDAAKALKRGRKEALEETGATVTTTSPGAPPEANEERNKKVARFRERNKKLAGTGWDNPARLKLIEDMNREKVTFTDLGYE